MKIKKRLKNTIAEFLLFSVCWFGLLVWGLLINYVLDDVRDEDVVLLSVITTMSLYIVLALLY